MRINRLVAAVAALLFITAGCSSSKTVPVKGTVLLDGRPLPDATVVFVRDPPGSGQQAQGITDDDGFFELGTLAMRDGALPGDYKVLVSYKPAYTESELNLPDEANQKEVLAKMEKLNERKKPSRYTIPAKYSNLNETPLKEHVPTNGEVELNLKSK